MKFTKCTVIPKLKFTKCTGIPKLMSINNCNLPRWRIPKMKFSPNWNQYQMMSTQRWEFFTVGQFQFGKISKWMNLNLVGNQFGSFTMGVNLKKVNINLEFVSERSVFTTLIICFKTLDVLVFFVQFILNLTEDCLLEVLLVPSSTSPWRILTVCSCLSSSCLLSKAVARTSITHVIGASRGHYF